MARKAIPKRLRFKILERDGFRCVYCGASPPSCVLHVDHKVPVSKGGGNEESNLVAACSDCNLGKWVSTVKTEGEEKLFPYFEEDSTREQRAMYLNYLNKLGAMDMEFGWIIYETFCCDTWDEAIDVLRDQMEGEIECREYFRKRYSND